MTASDWSVPSVAVAALNSRGSDVAELLKCATDVELCTLKLRRLEARLASGMTGRWGRVMWRNNAQCEYLAVT